MTQRKDVEHGLLDLESIPLLPLQNQQCSSSGNCHRIPLTAILYMNSENEHEDTIEEKIETKSADPDFCSWLGPEEGINTEHDKSYVEDLNTKAMLGAIECDKEEDIKRLVDAGADPNATYPLTLRQEEYLYIAVWDEDMEGYKKIPTWTRGRPAWNMLQFASATCRAAAVRALLACGARPGDVRARRTALDVAGAAFHYGCPVLPDHFTQTVMALVDGGVICSAVACNGTASPLHTAARLRCARAADALLRAGAAWSFDADGLTPIHRAVELKCEDTLEVLLSNGGKEVANAVSRVGESALFCAVAAPWAVGCVALLRAGASSAALCAHPERPFTYWRSTESVKLTPLHLAIESNNIDIVDKILTLAEQKHINCLNNDGETPLHTAIICERLACVKMLLRHGASLRNLDERQSNVLHVAALYSSPNSTSILKYLLENVDVTDIINELDGVGQGPIHKALRVGPESVKMILDKGADVRLKMEGPRSKTLFTPLHEAGAMQDSESAVIILGYDRTAIDDLDAMGRTPLITAALNEADYVVRAIVSAGALLSNYPKGEGKQSAIKMITAKLPNPTDFLMKIFDPFLYIVGATGSADSVIDYRPLINESEKDPLKVVEELVRCGQRKVLLHPVLETLLYLKWLNLLPIFFLLLGTYAIFVITLNIFVAMVFYYGDTKEEMPNSVIKVFWVDIVLLYGSICFLILEEFICMRARGSSYWRSLETWLKLGSVALGAALPPWLLTRAAGAVAGVTGAAGAAGVASAATVASVANAASAAGAAGATNVAGAAARHAASAALLLAWLQMMFLLAHFPRWGYYVLMMGKVASNIAKILLTSVFLVLGFALSFMVQFHAAPPFDGPLAAFTKTIVMMASEFDYEDLFGKDHDIVLADAITMVRLLFILFLLFVSIVLMNIIVGVAVNDIHNLTVSGNVRRLQKQLELLRTLDTLVYDGILGKILPGATVSTINKRRFISKMVVNPGTTKIWTVHCENEDDNYKIVLPTHLYHAAVRTSFNMTEIEFTTKKVNNMVNMLYDALIKGTDTIDAYTYRQYSGVKVKSKVDDVLKELKKLNDVKEDLKKLQNFYYNDERHRFTRQCSR